MAEELSADLHTYAAATQKLRESAKWLLAAAAGVGGLLIAGLQLSSLGELTSQQWPRIVAAVIGLVVALTGVGVVIARAGALLTQDWVTLRELATKDLHQRVNEPTSTRWWKFKWWKRRHSQDAVAIYADVGLYQEELYGNLAETPEDLWQKLLDANERVRERAASGSTAPDDSERQERELRLAVQKVVEFANYQRTRANFRRLQRVLFWSSVAVVAGVVVFAIAAHSPAPAKPESQGSDNKPAGTTTATVSPSRYPSVVVTCRAHPSDDDTSHSGSSILSGQALV